MEESKRQKYLHFCSESADNVEHRPHYVTHALILLQKGTFSIFFPPVIIRRYKSTWEKSCIQKSLDWRRKNYNTICWDWFWSSINITIGLAQNNSDPAVKSAECRAKKPDGILPDLINEEEQVSQLFNTLLQNTKTFATKLWRHKTEQFQIWYLLLFQALAMKRKRCIIYDKIERYK